jgi:hypothetical protein
VVFGVAEEVLAGLREMNVLSPPVRFPAVAVVFDPETAKRVTPTGTQRADLGNVLTDRKKNRSSAGTFRKITGSGQNGYLS